MSINSIIFKNDIKMNISSAGFYEESSKIWMDEVK
jgi:hypothetical protein